jgi:dihydrofolate synthase/folylpolyglutamate synthase
LESSSLSSFLPSLFSFASLSIPIPGTVQAENAGLAVVALKTAFPGIGEDAIRGGLERVKIRGRFEKISDNPPLIVDGAHTPESASLCVETFCSLYGEGGVLLFGCAADKNAAAMAEILLPRFSRVFITAPGTFRFSEPENVYRAFANLGIGARGSGSRDSNSDYSGASELDSSTFDHSPQSPVPSPQSPSSPQSLMFVKDTREAVKQALQAGREKGLPVLCTGSFYLVSEVCNYVSLRKNL